MKKIWTIILSLILLNQVGLKVFAASDGDGTIYFKQNVGIKVEPNTPLTESLTINGSMIISDGTQGLDKLLKTDANGLASWVPASYFPGLDRNGTNLNHMVISNGYFQDLYLNGTTTVDTDGRLKFPGVANGYVLTMHTNGNAHWSPNYGSSGTSSDKRWFEDSNTLYPKTNAGDINLVVGATNTASAEIVLYKNGGAHFNTGRASTEDFNVGTDQSFFGIKVETDEDQVGIKMGSPDTRLDVNGMFGLRADGTDHTVTPDNQSSVYWVAQNSSYGNNGDVLARISALAQDKVFKLVDFEGTTDGVTTQNGIYLTDLDPNRLVATDASKRLISENSLISAPSGNVGMGNANPLGTLEVSDAVFDFIDGVDDLGVEGDIEADGTIYAASFVGDSSGLDFNGVTIRHAKIHTSWIFESLDFNGVSQIRAADAPLFLDANLEFKGDTEQRSGNRFQLMGAPSEDPRVTFHVANGRVGVNTLTPAVDFDLNGQLAIRDGTESTGYVFRAINNTGLGEWQYIDTANVAHATNVDNATTANYTDRMVNATIINSTFINGVINGATLVNVDLTGAAGASEWEEGPDGLYPRDGAGENVMVGGTTLASSTISMESNGTMRAVRFVGDFSEVSNIPYNQEWNDQGSYLFPFDLAGAEAMVIGGTTVPTADSVFSATGAVTINEQAQDSDLRVEGQGHLNLFTVDASEDKVGFRTTNPSAELELNGSSAFTANSIAVSAAAGFTSVQIQNSRIVVVESTGACAVDLTASPQIASGVDGQIITLMGRYSDEIITLDDGDGLALQGNKSFALAAKDTITLMYSSALGEWIEITRTNYLERVGDSLDRGTCI